MEFLGWPGRMIGGSVLTCSTTDTSSASTTQWVEALCASPEGERKTQAARELSFLEMADLRLAAWFLWMTPFDTALSS